MTGQDRRSSCTGGRAAVERSVAFPSFATVQAILNLGMLSSTEDNDRINLRSMVRSEGGPHVLIEANKTKVRGRCRNLMHGQTRLLNDRRLLDHKSGNRYVKAKPTIDS